MVRGPKQAGAVVTGIGHTPRERLDERLAGWLDHYPAPFMTTHAPERTRAPISALRLLYEATAGNSQARLDLDALSSLRTGPVSRAMAPASTPRLGFASTVVTECASLMNGPGYEHVGNALDAGAVFDAVRMVDRLRACPSFDDFGKLRPVGARAPLTRDLDSAAWELYLVHESLAQVDHDADLAHSILRDE